jgi:hypothetical protein
VAGNELNFVERDLIRIARRGDTDHVRWYVPEVMMILRLDVEAGGLSARRPPADRRRAAR